MSNELIPGYTTLIGFNDDSRRIVCPMLDEYLKASNRVAKRDTSSYVTSSMSVSDGFTSSKIIATTSDDIYTPRGFTAMLRMLCGKSFNGSAYLAEKIVRDANSKVIEHRTTIRFDS